MVRLFLRFYGVLIATLILSFLVQMQLMDYVYSQMAPHFDYRVRFVPTFVLMEEALRDVPASEHAARFASIARRFGLPSRLTYAGETPERARMRPEQLRAFDAGGIVAVDNTTGFTLVRRLAGSGEALALDLPGADNSHLRLVTYAANWSVEFTLVAVLVWFWVRPFWRELRSLRSATEAIGDGRFDTRAVTGRASALRQVAEAINTMAGQVSTLLQSHRSLTSAVSHELRTPIARLRFSHSLARETPDAGGKDRLLARMEDDIEELDALTTELLDYARLERGTPRLDWKVVPADPWLEDVLADARAGPGPDVAIRSDVSVEEVHCEPRYMARAIVNVLRNARTHARSTVAVSLRRDNGGVVIDIDDDGPGIPVADRERLFEPFARLDAHRGRDSGGFGLGLSIVRQVARWHGGDACIADSPLGGARVSIAW